MDYRTVDAIMSAKNLAHYPAFDDVTILIQQTPNLNGCPLGLYYPETATKPATIILHTEATEAALLHELGHRYGDYHLDDLSERYAENFRAKHQKGGALLYRGSNFARLPKFGTLFEEGERGVVKIDLAQQVTLDELRRIKSQFYPLSNNEPIPRFYYGGGESPWVRIDFTKGVDWLVITGAVLAGTIVAGIGAIGYAIYKTAKDTPWVVPVALIGIGGFFLTRAMLKRTALI